METTQLASRSQPEVVRGDPEEESSPSSGCAQEITKGSGCQSRADREALKQGCAMGKRVADLRRDFQDISFGDDLCDLSSVLRFPAEESSDSEDDSDDSDSGEEDDLGCSLFLPIMGCRLDSSTLSSSQSSSSSGNESLIEETETPKCQSPASQVSRMFGFRPHSSQFSDIINSYSSRKALFHSDLLRLINSCRSIFSAQPNVLNIPLAKSRGSVMHIFGDTHGSFEEIISTLGLLGRPHSLQLYLFNGDVVDRGKASLELLIVLLMLVCDFPQQFFLLRGNHECMEMTGRFGFMDEVLSAYDSFVYDSFCSLFRSMPIAAVVNDSVFVCHGGLFRRDGILVEELQKLNRENDREASSIELITPLLWSDPTDEVDGRLESVRGCREACQFGASVTRDFLRVNHLSLLIRSHQWVPQGFKIQHDGRCITVFSSTNYMGTKNSAAFLSLHFDGAFFLRAIPPCSEIPK